MAAIDHHHDEIKIATSAIKILQMGFRKSAARKWVFVYQIMWALLFFLISAPATAPPSASKDSASWDVARDPVLYPLLYNPLDSSFEVLTPSATPRLYHSSCNVLPDGCVLVGVGNHSSGCYNFTEELYPIDSLDAFSPPYLATENDEHRPFIASLVSDVMGYGRNFTLIFFLESLDYGTKEKEEIQQLLSVTILAPSFTTHSYSMNQRFLRLRFVEVHTTSGIYEITVKDPPSGAFAPSGYYLLFVMHSGIPSQGKWVKLIQTDQ